MIRGMVVARNIAWDSTLLSLGVTLWVTSEVVETADRRLTWLGETLTWLNTELEWIPS